MSDTSEQSMSPDDLGEDRKSSLSRRRRTAGLHFGLRVSPPHGSHATRRAHWRQGPLRRMEVIQSVQHVRDMAGDEDAEKPRPGEAASFEIVAQMVEVLMADLAKEGRVSMPRIDGSLELEDLTPGDCDGPGTELSVRLQRVETVLRSLAEVLLVAM